MSLALPDVEDMLCDALRVITDRTGTPHPERVIVPPFLLVARVPGGPPAQSWQIRPQIQITHYGSTRKEAWALVDATDALLSRLSPTGGRLAGWFVDSAVKVVDPALVVDENADVRPVPTVWRLAIREQLRPAV